MKKEFFMVLTSLLLLGACQANDQTGQLPNSNTPSQIEEKGITPQTPAFENRTTDLKSKDQDQSIRKYKLEAPDVYTPVYLELYPDQTFSMDFNYCQGMAKGHGSYTVENGLHTLKVTSSPDMASLNTVTLELKQISDTELQVVSEVYRLENGQKVYFCTPMNDVYDQYEGEDYNLYKLVEEPNSEKK